MKGLAGVVVLVPMLLALVIPMAAAVITERDVQLAAEVDELARGTERNRSAGLATSARCYGDGDGNGSAAVLDSEQLTNAARIIETAEGYPVEQWGAVVAVATAMQESSLRNVDHGDEAGPDSRGLFQQRLQFYAAEGNPMDPVRATEMFLRRLLLVPDWQTIPLTEAAQAVQISAHPDLYAQWEPLAVDLVAQMWGEPCAASGGVAAITGAYALPLPLSYFEAYPQRFAGTHHDYPSVDVVAPTGMDSYAFTGGVVQWVSGRCGLGVAIDGDDGHRYIACHYDSRRVGDGARVEPGDLIGLIGDTGNSFGPHLHFDIRVRGEHRCPQTALVAVAEGYPVDISALPRTGCTH